MGTLTSFIQKFMHNGINGEINPELDEVRSEYPLVNTSGWFASTGRGSLVAVPSTKTFRLRTVIVENNDSVSNHFAFYDGPGTSVPVFRLIIAKSAAEVITGLNGILFLSACHVSTISDSNSVKVGGQLVESI